MKILIAEDTEDSRIMLEMLVTSMGYEVMSAENGIEALHLARTTPPDLIISDILMPEMDGFDLCRKIKADPKLKNIPFVFYTATYTERQDKELALALGASRFVVKPIELQALMEIIQEVLTEFKTEKLPTQQKPANDKPRLNKMQMHSVSRKLDKKIRELEQEQKALQKSEDRYRSLLEANPNPIIVYDKEGKVTYLNLAFTRVFGWTYDESLNLKIGFFVPEENWPETRIMIEKVEAGQYFSGVESCRYNKAGKLIPVSISGSNYQDKDGTSIGSIINLQDITEQKMLEAQFRQSQKMEAVGVLAGGVAHDFNNLLSIIIGNADLALMDTGIDGSLREEIEEIRTAGERGAALTRQLLAFSRKQIVQPRILDLNELLAGVEKMLVRLISEDVEVLKISEPALWQVEIDPGQMEQVIINLAINAKDAMPKGGKLTIETANIDLDENYCYKHGVKMQTGSYVMLAVSDTGIGMDKEIQSHIFEPFYTTKKKGKGTGLGLSTIYGIVKQNNGFVWVYSEPGQGSTFKIYLPKAKRDAALERKEQSPETERGGSETILVVEDDDALRKLAGSILQHNGYKVLEAENGEDALRKSREHEGSIELMLTDVVMPKMGGKETAEQLQPFRPQMKILYMSGYTDNSIVHHGVLAAELNFLQKPFSSKDLACKVREVLDKKQD